MALEAGELSTFMTELKEVVALLDEMPVIEQAKKSIKETLADAEISREERDRLYSNYVQQISIGVLQQGIDIVKTAVAAKYAEEAAKYGVDEAKYKAMQAEAALRKQYGYSVDEYEKMNDEGDGTIDEQNNGFYIDAVYKAVKVFSEQAAMLAQNDIETPPWMVDVMKIGAEIMSRGHINLKEAGEGDETVTVVEYVPDAEGPNGLDA